MGSLPSYYTDFSLETISTALGVSVEPAEIFPPLLPRSERKRLGLIIRSELQSISDRQSVDRRELPGERRVAQDREGIAGARRETVDQGDVERPVERGHAGDRDLTELAAPGGAADLGRERAGGGLGVVAADGQRASGPDRHAAVVRECPGGAEI